MALFGTKGLEGEVAAFGRPDKRSDSEKYKAMWPNHVQESVMQLSSCKKMLFQKKCSNNSPSKPIRSPAHRNRTASGSNQKALIPELSRPILRAATLRRPPAP
jgi:hypothetical protein